MDMDASRAPRKDMWREGIRPADSRPRVAIAPWKEHVHVCSSATRATPGKPLAQVAAVDRRDCEHTEGPTWRHGSGVSRSLGLTIAVGGGDPWPRNLVPLELRTLA
jgi:hypothetical protein